jgi:hypothetical protein
MVGGQHYEYILIALAGLLFGEKEFAVNFGEGCVRSVQCNVGFACQLLELRKTRENIRL